MVLPTVERMIRTMPVEEICSYAPIGGIPGFNEAVQISLFGQASQRFFVESAPTPGGCGALRHAVWNFLENGDAMLTTDWFWGPYRNICEEHGRRLETFPMFDEEDRFNCGALEQALGGLLELSLIHIFVMRRSGSGFFSWMLRQKSGRSRRAEGNRGCGL